MCGISRIPQIYLKWKPVLNSRMRRTKYYRPFAAFFLLSWIVLAFYLANIPGAMNPYILLHFVGKTFAYIYATFK